MNRNISIEAPAAARIFFLFTLDAKTVADGMEKIGVSGETRTILSNPFGYYRIANIPTGDTYVFSVSHKRYAFAQSTQIRTIIEETNDVNFVADN